jgi:hypothetical protein
MVGVHLMHPLTLPHALMRSCVVKICGFRRKQQPKWIQGHPGPILLQMVMATKQRAKHDDVVSYVNIRRVVTRVQ